MGAQHAKVYQMLRRASAIDARGSLDPPLWLPGRKSFGPVPTFGVGGGEGEVRRPARSFRAGGSEFSLCSQAMASAAGGELSRVRFLHLAPPGRRPRIQALVR